MDTLPPPMYSIEYRNASAAGTVTETCAPIRMGANLARNLAIPRTTGMPHRPSSSDGQPSIFVSSNPIGRRYRLSKVARRCAGLSLAIGGFGSAAVPTVSYRRRTVRHGFYRIPNHTGSRYRGMKTNRLRAGVMSAKLGGARLMPPPKRQDSSGPETPRQTRASPRWVVGSISKFPTNRPEPV